MNKLIILLLTSIFSLNVFADSPIKYGKFTHLKTEGKAVAFILGNETWDVKYSPSNDGIFIWANKHSIPSNIRVYTSEMVYTANIHLSTQSHVDEITPKAESLKRETAGKSVNIIQTNPVDKLIENANRAILEKKKRQQLEQLKSVPQPNQPIGVNIHSSGSEEFKKKIAAANQSNNNDATIDENGLLNITITGSSNKTVRQVVTNHFVSKGWKLIEYPGDSRALDSIIADNITSLDELYHSGVNIESISFIPDQRAFRVKPIPSPQIIEPAPTNEEMFAAHQPEITQVPQEKTIKELIQPHLQERNLSLVELPGDEVITEYRSQATSINKLEELFSITDGKIAQIIIDNDTNTLRIISY